MLMVLRVALLVCLLHISSLSSQGFHLSLFNAPSLSSAMHSNTRQQSAVQSRSEKTGCYICVTLVHGICNGWLGVNPSLHDLFGDVEPSQKPSQCLQSFSIPLAS